MNKTIILGRLTKGVEVKEVKGLKIAEGSLAACGTKEPMFIDFTAFGKTAELLATVEKGKRVLIEGTLKMERFTNKEGKNVTKHKLVVLGFTFIEKKEDDLDL